MRYKRNLEKEQFFCDFSNEHKCTYFFSRFFGDIKKKIKIYEIYNKFYNNGLL